jgi:hypothetical protein
MPVGLMHDIEYPHKEFFGDILQKKVAHGINEDGLGLFPS